MKEIVSIEALPPELYLSFDIHMSGSKIFRFTYHDVKRHGIIGFGKWILECYIYPTSTKN